MMQTGLDTELMKLNSSISDKSSRMEERGREKGGREGEQGEQCRDYRRGRGCTPIGPKQITGSPSQPLRGRQTN